METSKEIIPINTDELMLQLQKAAKLHNFPSNVPAFNDIEVLQKPDNSNISPNPHSSYILSRIKKIIRKAKSPCSYISGTKPNSKTRIVQMLPTLAFGDAVGNHTLALYKLLSDNGYDTAIYARNIDPCVNRSGVYSIDQYHDNENTFILYHLSIGDELNSRIKSYKAKIIINYHNVTPGHFFEKYNSTAKKLCDDGLRDVQNLSSTPIACICDSHFNENELRKMGYHCPIEVIPILIPFNDYLKTPNAQIINKYTDDYVNIVFTGRVAPNKKQEDLLLTFYYYHKFINPKSRLILVGSFNSDDPYCQKLLAFQEKLELDSVIFTGQIPFDEILAYYKLASVFLCLSEHEGFCVPLVEAMFFGVPIIAYDKAAVGDTLGNSAILLKDKDPRIVAEAINLVITNKAVKKQILENEKNRLKDFDNVIIGNAFISTLTNYILLLME